MIVRARGYAFARLAPGAARYAAVGK
jgi:hypothetical protein